MKKINLLFLVLATGLFYSCQKEVDLQFDSAGNGGNGGGNTASIAGDYIFAGMQGVTNQTATIDILKTVSVDKYATENNGGDVKFTTDQLSYTNLTYAINSSVNVKLYLSGLLLSESDYPYSVPPSPISGSDKFVKNSNDSITFEKMIFIEDNIPAGAILQPKPMGAKISWIQDTLVFKLNHTMTGTYQENGQTANFSANFTGTVKFKKK